MQTPWGWVYYSRLRLGLLFPFYRWDYVALERIVIYQVAHNQKMLHLTLFLSDSKTFRLF